MKKRSGFITNSSSSCFVIQKKKNRSGYGWSVASVRSKMQCLCDFWNIWNCTDTPLHEICDISEDVSGDIIISTVNDNSIPLDLIPLIETKFETRFERID